jgi:glycosyltransferase involved in cell wall biosynthesis
MSSNLPRFSIIVVVMNRQATIQKCIDSVAYQQHSNKELIIIDGGSTDNTIPIIEANKSKVHYSVSEADTGIYNAMNKGIYRATGDWIIFLGADDYLLDSDVLTRVASRLVSTNCDSRLVYGRVAVVSDEDCCVLGEWGDFNHQIFGLPHQATFHHKSLFEIHGNFDESFRIAGDYELLLRELKCFRAAYLPDIIVAGFSNGGVSTDLNSAPLYWAEYARAQRNNGLNPYSFSWIKCFSMAIFYWMLSKVIPRKWLPKLKQKYSSSRLKTACGYDLNGAKCSPSRFSSMIREPIELSPAEVKDQ